MIDSETIAPTRPAGTDYAASHIGTATPNNCATTPRWRSSAALRRLSLRWSIYLLGPFLL
jgi:hypothetical protein